MPGIGVRTCARILTEVTGKQFASVAHLASYPGCLSAFGTMHQPPPKAYYDCKRAGGKRHNQALIAHARRRSDVLFPKLRDGISSRIWNHGTCLQILDENRTGTPGVPSHLGCPTKTPETRGWANCSGDKVSPFVSLQLAQNAESQQVPMTPGPRKYADYGPVVHLK
jgi:hypothetical protein